MAAAIMKYPGAKWAIAQRIILHIPRKPIYVEPFCGSAAVFFNLPWAPNLAVLNDMNGDIVNLLRVVRSDAERLATAVAMTPWAREEYYQSYTSEGDPIERARRFLVRTWQAHGADISARVGWRNVGAKGKLRISRHLR